jgi:hypothetical protein
VTAISADFTVNSTAIGCVRKSLSDDLRAASIVIASIRRRLASGEYAVTGSDFIAITELHSDTANLAHDARKHL